MNAAVQGLYISNVIAKIYSALVELKMHSNAAFSWVPRMQPTCIFETLFPLHKNMMLKKYKFCKWFEPRSHVISR